MKTSEPTTWLMLIHQVPNSPAYLRVKMWRRLQRIGAIAVKNAVYVLPRSDQSLEDFQWVASEIVAGGGEATVCEATFLEGITNPEVIDLFRAARAEDYVQIIEDLKSLEEEFRTAPADTDGWVSGMMTRVTRLRQRYTEVRNIDFFSATEGTKAASMLSGIETKLRKPVSRKSQSGDQKYDKRVWVTRRGIHIDRIASAWLIRKFIDPRA